MSRQSSLASNSAAVHSFDSDLAGHSLDDRHPLDLVCEELDADSIDIEDSLGGGDVGSDAGTSTEGDGECNNVDVPRYTQSTEQRVHNDVTPQKSHDEQVDLDRLNDELLEEIFG